MIELKKRANFSIQSLDIVGQSLVSIHDASPSRTNYIKLDSFNVFSNNCETIQNSSNMDIDSHLNSLDGEYLLTKSIRYLTVRLLFFFFARTIANKIHWLIYIDH